MDTHIYKDDQGNVIQAVSSSIPGLSIVPTGMTIADAIPVSPEEYSNISENHNQPYVEPPSVIDLAAQVEELKKLIQSLTK